MKKRKIRILIICAMLAANLAACVSFGAKTPADMGDGGTTEKTMASTESSTQDKVPQRSDDDFQKWSGQKIETEIHFLLDSDAVLDEDHKLKKEIRSEFDIGKKIKKFGVVYYDGTDRVFEREGWINRIRMQEGKADKGFELTYKKRYPVSGTDVDEAVRRAGEEGFDLSGESKRRLSGDFRV